MAKSLKYIFLPFLLVASGVVTSCIYDEYPVENEVDEVQFDGDVLKFTFTLDNMGGEAATRAENPLAKWENYVDPEKVRVLVFDNDDKFLFESKNRFIKQLNPSPDHSTWSVTIPMGSYGNDKEYDWDWDEIRGRMSAKSFKIALLVNRPDREWNMGILQRHISNENADCDPNDPSTYPAGTDPYVVPGGWFGSTGPHWDKSNSVASTAEESDWRDVFALHHCQYDPIYHGKNYYTTNGALKNTPHNFYGSVTEGDPGKPYMGATSSWVDWGTNDDAKNEWNYRYASLPSEKHPIPMYGIQEFAPITGWKKGTSVNLDRDGDKAISLLRSVVKLELLVPKGVADRVLLFYSNIYARCEPMDVWTPTDRLWTSNEDHYSKCEWNLIKDFRMALASDQSANNENSINYGRRTNQERLSRLYGIWYKEKGWSFNNDYNPEDIDTYFKNNYDDWDADQFGRIFNPCTQRNTAVEVTKCPGYESDLVYDHFVVYTGERNVNDASNLGQLGNNGAGNPTVIYWSIVHQTKLTNSHSVSYRKMYSLPIVQYNKNLTLSKVVSTGYVAYRAANELFIPGNGTDLVSKAADITQQNVSDAIKDGKSNSSTGMGTYLRKVHAAGISTNTNYDATFNDHNYWPLPLLRNHVYSITLSGVRNGENVADDEVPFAVHFEEKHTEDINFQ